MCSRQVTRLLLRSASVTKDSALPESCGNLSQLAESDARRNGAPYRERHHVALIAAIVCRIWQDRIRSGPSVRQRPLRFSNITETEAWHDDRCRAEERKLLCPKALRALRIPRRVVLRSRSTFHGETALRVLLRRMWKALLVACTCNEESLLTRSFYARDRPPYL